MASNSESPPDTAHPGYTAIENGETLLPVHKLCNAAALKYEEEAGELAEAYEDTKGSNVHLDAIVEGLARPWSSFNWEELRSHYFAYRHDTDYSDSVLNEYLEFIGNMVYAPARSDEPWKYVFRFRAELKDLDRIAMQSERPHQVAEMLRSCLEERTSWSEQDLALDAAISQLPLRLRGEIDASIIKCNYQLFLVSIMNALPVPEDQFDHHLRRYHALKVVYAHMGLLLEHFTERDTFTATIAFPLRPYAWVMYNVVMRFLYHIRNFDPSSHLKDRTIFGWTTGILWKWAKACHKFGAGLRALRDDHAHQPHSQVHHDRMFHYNAIREYLKDNPLSDNYSHQRHVFEDLISYHDDLDLSRDFIDRLRKSLEDLRRASFAGEALRVLPHSVDATFLGLDDEPGEKDVVAQLYDRMRVFVDVREYAYSEEHGAIGDM